MAPCASRQGRDGHHRREPATILADVGQLIDVLNSARGLEHQGLESRHDRRSELDAQRLGTCDHLLRIGNIRRRDLVHHFGRGVAQHPLGAHVEDLDDALRIGGDARKIALLKIAFCSAPAFSSTSSACAREVTSAAPSETLVYARAGFFPRAIRCLR